MNLCMFIFLLLFVFYRGNSWREVGGEEKRGGGREGKFFEMQAMCGFNCAKMVDSKVVLSCLSPTVYKALRWYITCVQWSSVVQTIKRPLVDRLLFFTHFLFPDIAPLTLAVDRCLSWESLFMHLLRCCGDLSLHIYIYIYLYI